MPRYYRSNPTRIAAPEPRKGRRGRRSRGKGVRFDFTSLPVLGRGRLQPRRKEKAHGSRRLSLFVRARRAVAQRVWDASHAGAGLLLVAALALLIYVFASGDFYVYAADIPAAAYTPPAAAFAAAGIAEQSIFYLDAGQIAANVATLPHVRSAGVRLSLPNRVHIDLQERQPAIHYQVLGASHWIDDEGVIMPVVTPKEGLIKLIDDEAAATQDAQQLDAAILQAVLYIHSTLPQVTIFRYQKPYGLYFFSPEGWRVNLGEAADMDAKLKRWEAVRSQIAAEGAFATEVDLRYKTPFWH